MPNLSTFAIKGYKFIQTLIYTTPGQHSFVRTNYPWLRGIRVKVQGAGGGGGGAQSTSITTTAIGGGGGGGCYAEKFFDETNIPLLSSTVPIVVGPGGAGGSGNTFGSNGVSSGFNVTLVGNSVVEPIPTPGAIKPFLVAAGGFGGDGMAATTTGSDASGTVKLYIYNGSGGYSITSDSTGNPGYDFAVIGGTGPVVTYAETKGAPGGIGGDSFLGRGAPSILAGSPGYSVNGLNGFQGGGGGGAANGRIASPGGKAGGAGGSGIVILELYA